MPPALRRFFVSLGKLFLPIMKEQYPQFPFEQKEVPLVDLEQVLTTPNLRLGIPKKGELAQESKNLLLRYGWQFPTLPRVLTVKGPNRSQGFRNS